MLATQSIQVRLVTMVCLWDGRIYQEPRAFRLNHDLRDIARGNGNPPYLLGCEVDQVRKRVLQVAPDLSRLFGEHVTLRCSTIWRVERSDSGTVSLQGRSLI